MKKNLWALVVANSLFGLAFGVYELAFPLFLDDKGVHLETIGLVLAAAGTVNFLVVVYGGRLADLLGRKRVYGSGLAACALTNLATPLVPGVGALAVVKTLQQAAVSVQQAMRGVLVFESVALDRFQRTFGRLAGLETSCHALGFLCVGMVGLGPDAVLSYGGLFAISGASLAIGWLVFRSLFRDHPLALVDPARRLSLRTVFAMDLHPKLYLIVASGFVFTVGLSASHALWPLYFREQLSGPWAESLSAFAAWLEHTSPWAARVWAGGARGPQFALISALAIVHRLAYGVPMFVLAALVHRRLKSLFIACLVIQGLMTVGVAVADWTTGRFLPVAVLWPLHDLVGASVWVPIQERLIQHFSRPDRRGTDVAKVRALIALGAAVGPMVGGLLMAVTPAMPFFVGGGLCVLSSLVLLAL